MDNLKQPRITYYGPVGWIPGAMVGAALLGTPQLEAQDAKPAEEKGWETTAGAGATLVNGNSKSFLATFGIDSHRKWAHDEMLMGATAGYGKTTAVNRTDGLPDPETTTASFAKGFSQYNHLFTERFYAGLRIDGLHDDISDVYYRFTISPLAGYYFIKNAKTSFSGDIGPSYIVEKVGNDGPRGYAGLRAGERFEHKFESKARIWETADITPEIDNWDNYLVNFEAGVDAPITKSLSARLVAQDVYDHEPSPGRLKNDFKLIAGLAYKF